MYLRLQYTKCGVWGLKKHSITGCSTGIGRAIALECGRQGAKLILHHIGNSQSAEGMATLKTELHYLAQTSNVKVEAVDVAGDVRDPDMGQKCVFMLVSYPFCVLNMLQGSWTLLYRISASLMYAYITLGFASSSTSRQSRKAISIFTWM